MEYFITNPNPDTPVHLGEGRFENPLHTYHAVEVTANRRLRDNWLLLASYRWSRLFGNFEGFFRNDNGQSDPAITSLFDFPTNDPSYVRDGRALGFRGDIRYLGTLGAGLLPNDRTHQVKLHGAYFWRDLTVGIGMRAGSGAPLTAFAANPIYDSHGEIPETPRGAGIETVDGFRKRAPFAATLDLHLAYPVRLPGRDQAIVLLLDAFNLLDNQDPLMYDFRTETAFRALNPNGPLGANGAQPLGLAVGAQRNANSFPAFRAPRALRFGVRYDW